MRITGLSSPLQTALLAVAPKTAAFAMAETPTAAAPPNAPSGQPVSVEMLVALAASQSPVDRRRRATDHAARALDALDRLNAEVMAGLPTVARLREIAALTEPTGNSPEDQALAELFKDIELRMRVELAKHDITA